MYDASSFAGYRVFDKPKNVNFIHADKINAVSNQHGPGEKVPLLRHPKITHNLLSNIPDNQSFKPKTSSELWAGGKFPKWGGLI